MESLRELIEKLPLGPKIKENLIRQQILIPLWESLLPPHLRTKCSFYAVEEDQLILSTEDHYLLQELRLYSHLICQRFNQILREYGLPPLKGIRGRLQKKSSEERFPKNKSLPLEKKDILDLQNLCQDISDRELRESFLNLLQRIIKGP